MGLLLFYAGFAVIISFICSLLEAVILSLPLSYLAILKKEGKKSGHVIFELKKDIDKPLAAILTFNTIAHTVGAAGVGAQVLVLYGDTYVAVSSAIMTIVILVFTEILPKTIGAKNAKSLVGATSVVIPLMIKVTYPFVLLSKRISGMIGTSGYGHNKMTREEVIVSAEMGASDGSLHQKESLVIKNLLRLNNIYVRDIMTPRSVLVALPKDLTVQEVMARFTPIPFSRIPIFEKNLDTIVGMVLRYKILESSAHDKDTLTLEQLAQQVTTIPDSMPVASCLDEFIRKREHQFIVTDQYGTTTGLVTLEDCIETLLGVEIVDEFDSVEDMRQFALEQWEKRKQERLANAGKKIKTDSN